MELMSREEIFELNDYLDAEHELEEDFHAWQKKRQDAEDRKIRRGR